MVSVFKEHNTFFDGEDLQMGVILHGFNQGYSIKCVGNVSVETEVPSHFICWNWRSEKARTQYPIPVFHDLMRLFFVAPLKCGGWGCGYNEKSLFRQRVASWDKGAHRCKSTLLMPWPDCFLCFAVLSHGMYDCCFATGVLLLSFSNPTWCTRSGPSSTIGHGSG